MDLIIGWKPFSIDYQGQPVTMEVRPLKRAAALKVLPFLRTRDNADQDAVAMVADTFAMQALAGDIIPDHVRGMDLLINGEPVKPLDLAEETVLTPLAGAIIAELIRISFVTRADQKNSGGPLGS